MSKWLLTLKNEDQAKVAALVLHLGQDTHAVLDHQVVLKQVKDRYLDFWMSAAPTH
jgi:hypothetical protein